MEMRGDGFDVVGGVLGSVHAVSKCSLGFEMACEALVEDKSCGVRSCFVNSV